MKAKKKAAKRKVRMRRVVVHDPKMMGAAIINSHLEAIRVALVIYGIDWRTEGYPEHLEELLLQVDRVKR